MFHLVQVPQGDLVTTWHTKVKHCSWEVKKDFMFVNVQKWKKGKQDYRYFLTFAILSYSDFVLVWFSMILSIFSGNQPPFISLLISGTKFQSLGIHTSHTLCWHGYHWMVNVNHGISTCISHFTSIWYTNFCYN